MSQKPDPERVWLQIYIAAIGGLSSVDAMNHDGVLAREAKGIADAGLAEYEARWCGVEPKGAAANGSGNASVQNR